MLHSLVLGCSAEESPEPGSPAPAPPKEKEYDETGLLYTSVDGLVMAGYQGWFGAEGDASERGWYHYQNQCGFMPGCSTIDMWPDMTDYPDKYESPFIYADGSPAFLFSSFDESTIDLHFKWMKEYGIDGVYMQRFVAEVRPSNEKGKRHFDTVLGHALKAAKKYDRAICIMYDLSGATAKEVREFVEEDFTELQSKFDLFDNKTNPTYLRHNGKPLVAVWGVGFNDNRPYGIDDAKIMLESLKGYENKYSVMLGVPYRWRTLGDDTVNDSKLHDLIKDCDVIMPWAVGRYSSENYTSVAGETLVGDIQWCKSNNVDYIPLAFPGFSWGNMYAGNPYNAIPRHKGDFLWKQVAGAKMSGASSLYLAMFDEIDEGTAIFKVSHEGDTPSNGDGRFIGIDPELQTDHYLWLAGEAAKWFHGSAGYGPNQPSR
ncbi:glycoside hydrolase family 71/99-like protein [Echinicola shivajiensis]|uniref:glycoside hydrolase family 71/99-like protein n=1 Tax=Echinicola shivajiensis TaxID=1035916 RepID=UPI001FE921DE|nr:glycoside hydrolase family 71/99-like protein [Echinicola shivajiensis]